MRGWPKGRFSLSLLNTGVLGIVLNTYLYYTENHSTCHTIYYDLLPLHGGEKK